MIDPAKEVQATAGVAARQVAGAVQALAGLAIGVRHEAFGGQAGALVVTLGQAVAADVQVSRHPRGAGQQVAVEQQQAGALDRLAQFGAGAGAGQCVARRPDGGFGRAVQVPQRGATGQQPYRQVIAERLPAA
ncbi:hypothetical protein D3C79_678810 [compost metagenome]